MESALIILLRLRVLYYFLGGSEVIYHQWGLVRKIIIENLALRSKLGGKGLWSIKNPKTQETSWGAILGTPELGNQRSKSAHKRHFKTLVGCALTVYLFIRSPPRSTKLISLDLFDFGKGPKITRDIVNCWKSIHTNAIPLVKPDWLNSIRGSGS